MPAFLPAVGSGILDPSALSPRQERAMPKFIILSRVDAYVDYTTEVEADSLEEAVDLAYDGDPSIKWKEQGVVEFDARHVVALDADGEEIERYSRGKG
jgi:hypothetical protein